MKLTSKGQVTIPQALRERFALHPRAEVSFEAMENGVLIKRAQSRRERFATWVRKACGSATVKLSTDEIMRLTRGER